MHLLRNHYRGEPLLGGVLGGLVVTGVRRASFSNEAGIGTAPMALGASKSREPIREGLVSMLSPAIDTLLVCTLTALSILVTDVWRTSGASGVTLTVTAFESSLGGLGKILLLISAFFFAITSLFSYSYYGNKALSFLFGVKSGKYYDYFYLSTIIFRRDSFHAGYHEYHRHCICVNGDTYDGIRFCACTESDEGSKKLFWEVEIKNALNHGGAKRIVAKQRCAESLHA